ncbi:MAG: ABC transporter ATP-binding protein [Pseudomonadota bacterium]
MFFDQRLWSLTAGARGDIAICVFVGVLAAVVGIARLALLGLLIGAMFTGTPVTELGWAFAGVAAVMLVRGHLEHWRTMTAHRTAARLQVALRERLHDKVLALGPQHFGMQRTGDVLLSVVEGVEQLEVWFGQYLPQLFVAAITPLVVFALLAPFDVVLAAILLVFALLTLVAPAVFHRWDMSNSMRRSVAYRSFGAEFLDALQGLATLKAFGQSEARGAVLAHKADEVFRTTMWVLATNSLSRGITDTGLAVGTAVALGVGAYRVQGGEMDISILLMVLMAGIEVFRPQRDLRSLLHNGMMGLSAAAGVFEVLNARIRIEPPAAPHAGSELAADVAFESVEFSYPDARQAAHAGLSFHVSPGERVGFVGASGAGKSTVVKLLLRLYDPDAGAVRIGGVPVSELAPDMLYGQLAVVAQDTFLFHGTVAENLQFGRPEATADELRQAARDANALEFIERLPQGFETTIGERGIRLSGGQRQRIAIARALLKDAPVLVLDEALSSVDAENEFIIQEALDRLMEGRTTLIFAHRLSSVIGADRIHVLADGKIAETGTHAELCAARGQYFELMAEQIAAGDSTGEARPDSSPQAAGAPRADELRQAAVQNLEDGIVQASGPGWPTIIRSLFGHAAPYRVKLVLTFVFGITRVAALIGVGVLSALVVAAVKQEEPFEVFLWWLALAAPVAGIVHWLESWVAHDMAFRMLAEMRVALFKKFDELAPAYLTRRRSGDLVAMATHDVEMVEYFFAHTIAPAFVAILVPATVIVTLGWHALWLAAALLPFLALVAISPFALRARLDALGSRDREALGELNAYVVDSLQGLAEVKAFDRGALRRAGFLQRMKAHLDARLPFYGDLSKQRASLEIATGLGGLAVIFAGGFLVQEGRLAATDLPLLTLLALSAFLPVSEIAQIGRQLADTLGATRRLYHVEREIPAVAAPEQPVALAANARNAISFEHVNFSYPMGSTRALDGVSFDIVAGTSVALVGPSGAGKTTIAQLCLRFWDADEGTVRINDTPITALNPADLRARIALVSQDTYLFNDTLGENIRLARPDATPDALALAIERASLQSFVDALPDGLDTQVGERGMRLSGGQRQRVAIARAFLKDAPILILDEATSHLDAVNERAVRKALDTLMRDRTTLVIAHRLSTVRHCDQILVLEHGHLLESGTHSELVLRDGLYRRLSDRQSGVAA